MQQWVRMSVRCQESAQRQSPAARPSGPPPLPCTLRWHIYSTNARPRTISVLSMSIIHFLGLPHPRLVRVGLNSCRYLPAHPLPLPARKIKLQHHMADGYGHAVCVRACLRRQDNFMRTRVSTICTPASDENHNV